MQQEEQIKTTILAKSIADIFPNLLFFGIGVPIVIFFGRWFRWLGILGVTVYALVLFTDIIRIVIQLGTGALLLLGGHNAGVPSVKAQATSWVATLIQLLETAVFAVYTVILYRFFFV